jgi:hypothetical protein
MRTVGAASGCAIRRGFGALNREGRRRPAYSGDPPFPVLLPPLCSSARDGRVGRRRKIDIGAQGGKRVQARLQPAAAGRDGRKRGFNMTGIRSKHRWATRISMTARVNSRRSRPRGRFERKP